MINGVRFKVCGLTSRVDAELAEACGADYLGFIFHPRSPRFISVESYSALKAQLPLKPRVAVVVEPSLELLRQLMEEGFDFFQVHYPHHVPLSVVEAWSRLVSPAKLWLAPRVPPGEAFPSAHLALAETVLFDTYQSGTYGGTGKTGDWPSFVRLQEEYPRVNWILAGGLNAANIGPALLATGGRIVDVNSGVESVPGIKSAEKLKAFCEALKNVTGRTRTQSGRPF